MIDTISFVYVFAQLLGLRLLMLGLQLGMMTVVSLVVRPLPIRWSSLILETLLVQLGRPRRCTLRATTMQTS